MKEADVDVGKQFYLRFGEETKMLIADRRHSNEAREIHLISL